MCYVNLIFIFFSHFPIFEWIMELHVRDMTCVVRMLHLQKPNNYGMNYREQSMPCIWEMTGNKTTTEKLFLQINCCRCKYSCWQRRCTKFKSVTVHGCRGVKWQSNTPSISNTMKCVIVMCICTNHNNNNGTFMY